MPESKEKVYTDKQVDKARDDVEALRVKVEERKLELAASEANRANSVTMAALDAEKERLKAELAVLDDQLKVSKAPVADDQVVKQIEETKPGEES